MACIYLLGLFEPRCAARDERPVPTMVEEVSLCLGGEEERCPYYQRARAAERVTVLRDGLDTEPPLPEEFSC